MIPYVEIRNGYTLETVGIVEPQECWFELSWQDVGEFEVYCRESIANLNTLQKGRFVTIPNTRFIWFITSIRYSFTAGGARMISAKGYEAKWLLKKRCIQTPKELQGTITSAVYGLVKSNIGADAISIRKIAHFETDTIELLIDISGTQAPRANLLEFTNNLLKSYNCGSQVVFEDGRLKYTIFAGDVRTNTVKFSQSFDNLLSSEYFTDDAEIANNALVVSTVDDVDYVRYFDNGYVGIDRAEILVNSNLSTKYEDENGIEQETTPTSELYIGWQKEEGKRALADRTTIEEINGEIDVVNSNYTFDVDFYIGDMITIQDEYFNFSTAARISKYTIKQDANGYGEEAEYGGIK